jgi:hypothetical protein
MELLVSGNIIKLDLPIKKVYEKVWRPQHPSPDRSVSAPLPPSTFYLPFQSLSTFPLNRGPYMACFGLD